MAETREPLITPPSMHISAPSLCSALHLPCFNRVYHLQQPLKALGKKRAANRTETDTGYIDSRCHLERLVLTQTASTSRSPLDMTIYTTIKTTEAGIEV